MKKTVFTFISTFLVTFFSFSQEKVYETDKAFISPEYNQNHSFALPNQKNGDFMLVLEGSKTLQGILLDKNYNEKKRVFAKALPSKFRYLLGYSIEDDTYSVVFTNKIQTKFGVIQFNIKNGQFWEKKLKLKLKNERLLESVVVNNKIYILTIERSKPHFSVYSFDEKFNYKKQVINLEKLEAVLNRDSKIDKPIYYHFMDETENKLRIDLAKIDTNSPIPIEIATHEKKLYLFKDKVLLTFDHSNRETVLVDLDLKNYTCSVTSIEKPILEEKFSESSNSFILDSLFFSISNFQDRSLLQIKNLLDDSLIKEILISEVNTQIFENSSIIMEKTGKNSLGFSIDRTKEKDISYFLKQMNSYNPGVSVFKHNDQYAITLGAAKKINYNAIKIISGITAFTPVAPVFQIAQFGNIAVSVGMNPNLYMFNSYKATRSTRFSSLLNEKFEYMRKEVPLNDFDHLSKFKETLKKPRAVNIFRNNNTLHFNYFDQKNKKFKLYKFE